jgi:hypothetical protein
MKRKVQIPTSQDDITVGQEQQINIIINQDLTEQEMDDEIIKLFVGLDDINDISKIDRDMFNESIGQAIQNEGEFKTKFTIGSTEFGMIPNFDKISGSEYTDLIKYSQNTEDLHRLMAVAFRPIKFKDRYKNYQITKYNGTGELSELMKQTPLSIAKGFHVFFLNLSKDLETYILKSIAEEQAKGIIA